MKGNDEVAYMYVAEEDRPIWKKFEVVK